MRTYADAEVRYFLLKSSAALEREVFGKGLPPGRVLLEGWERFVQWRVQLPYAKCLKGLQPRAGVVTGQWPLTIYGNRVT